MYHNPERARGVILRVLDTDTICAAIAEQVATGSEYEVAFAPYAVALTSDGTMLVVCHEGVGWVVTDDQPLPLEVFAKVKNAISILPAFTANLTPAEVNQHTTDEPIDLADLVRTFGGRLEDNFWIHHRRLAGAVSAS